MSNSGWETVREELNTQAMPTMDDITIDSSALPLSEDERGNKFLQFYWIDAFEDPYHQPGTVFLFGKILIPESNAHVR